MREVIFFLFTAFILGVLILMSIKSERNIFPIMFFVALLVLSAFYLFQFGPLASFSIKALSAEANFIREKKREVAQDAEAIEAIKRQVEELLSESRKSQQEIETTKNEIIALQKELARTTQLALPPTLILTGRNTEKISSGYKLSIQFTPSKNVPLGVINFKASVVQPSDVRILDFFPSLAGGAFSTGPDSKKIKEDGKQASLTYSLISVGNPTFELTISGICEVVIEGNYIKNAITIGWQPDLQ